MLNETNRARLTTIKGMLTEFPYFNRHIVRKSNPIERLWEELKAKLKWQNCKDLKSLQQRLSDNEAGLGKGCQLRLPN